ncbi:hypothetical protein CURE108131_00955 [Cupriavidus respiraculi]|uniref:Uncharacterized protein n=1 Tax=Cupriavidus respiraculi TaxID=195930 RepID=A0ABM8WDM8_9BURK|nr:hypothetical protein LMG21510_00063 [Cupriavidus respiraculi]
MSLRDSLLVVSGWVLLCVGSGFLLTTVAQALPA